jgi:hypothetical protein
VELDGNEYDLVINNGVQTVNIPLSYMGNEWTMIGIRFTAEGIRAVRNDTNLGLYTTIMGEYGGASTIMDSVVGSLFDVRRIPRDVDNNALGYYYSNIVSEQGNNFLPPMR